jgi:hypothetical protein
MGMTAENSRHEIAFASSNHPGGICEMPFTPAVDIAAFFGWHESCSLGRQPTRRNN